MKVLAKILKVVDNIILNILKAITIVSFLVLTILITAGILIRFFPVMSLHWFDEIIELVFAYLVFYGAAALWISGGHFSSGDWVGNKLFKYGRKRHFYQGVLEITVLLFAAIFFYYSLRLTLLTQAVTNAFAIPKKVLYSCMPISGGIMIIYSIRNIIREIICIIRPEQVGSSINPSQSLNSD